MQNSGCSGLSCSVHRSITPLTVPHWFSGVSSSSRPDCAVLPSLPTRRVGTAQEAEERSQHVLGPESACTLPGPHPAIHLAIRLAIRLAIQASAPGYRSASH